MRTYKATDTALDTVFRVPCRYLYCNGTFFFKCYVVTDRAIQQEVSCECADRHIIALQTVDYCNMVIEIFVTSQLTAGIKWKISPSCIHRNFFDSGFTGIDCLVVQLYNSITLLGVGFLRCCLHQLNSCIVWHDLLIQCEECRLQNRVGSTSHTDFLSDFSCVDDVEFCMLFSKLRLHTVRHMLNDFFFGEGSIQQEASAFLDIFRHVIFEHVSIQ